MNSQIVEINGFLEKTLANLTSIGRDEFYSTTSTLDSILTRHYDAGFAYKQDLKTIRQHLGMLVSSKKDNPSIGFSLNDIKVWYKTLLESMKEEINILGLPQKEDVKIDKSIKISVNQQQSQDQKQIQKQFIEIFIDSIKNEITGKQLKELQEIIRGEPNVEKSKHRILEKLKEFGIDVCTNIVSNIITNPLIWSGLL